MRTYVRMVVCVYLPRFELSVAVGDRSSARQALGGRALAVAPLAGTEQRVGEVSGTAEAFGVLRGMVLGEALARCPELVLVPADPVRVAEAWEAALRALHGGDAAVIAAARNALDRPARMGAGSTRFCALAAALAVRSRRALVLDREAGRWLAGRPIALLGFREQTAALVAPLSRLGVRTLGELERLGRAALTDRFGVAGTLAHALACGEDSPLRPRQPEECLEESMEVGDASSGTALKRVLGVLVNRLLARAERRGRTLRAVVLSAQMLAGGGWRERVVFRQALSDPERIWLALSVRLQGLPAPAGALGLAVERFGPPASDQ